ncbi:putative NADPH-adrenodoxin reductase Arh1 [Eremomyces bilateralis CBS 781.70]|uniref:NADPH:adrenodoxin oxidoreductase, mitochondrial n=1 Tax=Eremomyces bilateralis CBS 781.70 TaxID=1392243 RepID=A0A6G1G154_9PEZI|nr:putative NADPH-adrenodoxin reductase Arh1 [Eremomyces bilateralis CBS 781.70]KAF1811784.1 putative NADPH-adrenodoxin reductase Arh1 [Eremomyces bilateralis CBS 781.70]
MESRLSRVARQWLWRPTSKVAQLKGFSYCSRFIAQFHRHASSRAYSSATQRPFRAAIIGSGPAGFYTAYRVMQRIESSVIDMYEHLPVPFGLVRYGVAPDHPEVKNCQDKFEEVADSARFNFIGNVDVGHQISLSALAPHYDAIVFAYGAAKDNKLDIPGEHLNGIYSAREFVGWYNGLPEFADLNPRLDNGEQAVVIGQGNVALDVARVLLTPPDQLRGTDMAENAIDTLSRSRIRSVKVVGRRGPMQASFTIKELRELLQLPSVSFTSIPPHLLPQDPARLPRQSKRLMQLLAKGSTNHVSSKNWDLDFLMSPTSFHPSPGNAEQLASVSFMKNEFRSGADPLDKSARVQALVPGDDIPASAAFRSVGYKSLPLPGMDHLGVSFDLGRGIIINDGLGRAIRESASDHEAFTAIRGVYCAGWVKRGPVGVIASTMQDAFATADSIVEDWNQGLLEDPSPNGARTGWEAVREAAEKAACRPVSWSEWRKIDQVEKERGQKSGKPREKLTSVKEMLEVLDG